MKKHIFTIMAGCAPVGNVMLESFIKHHPEERINRYMFFDDIANSTRDLDHNPNITTHLLPESLKEDFLSGHAGTAKVWARVITQNPDSYLIQIDSDVVFKKESISLIEKAGYPDIYGSRRCYQNNPGKAPVPEGVEDAVSTYFLGFNSGKLKVESKKLYRMIQGVYNPLGFSCLDFFDPVFFWMRHNGASVYFEDQEIIGGQDYLGSKKSKYPSNMHLDMGSHLAHFGGVGSGYAASKWKMESGKLKMEKSYRDWAIHRWHFFRNFFIEKQQRPDYILPEFDESGRWVGGMYNSKIWNQVKEDLSN